MRESTIRLGSSAADAAESCGQSGNSGFAADPEFAGAFGAGFSGGGRGGIFAGDRQVMLSFLREGKARRQRVERIRQM